MARSAKSKKAAVSADAGASDDQIKKETGKDLGAVERWIEEIALAKERAQPYNDKVKSIVDRYKDAKKDETERKSKDRRYNVLWSIKETLEPLVYSSPPRPYITRKNNDKDPVARDASMLLERGLRFTLEGDELHDTLTDGVEDYLLGSRAVAWHKYTPYLKLRESEDKTYVNEGDDYPDDAELKEDDKGTYYHATFEEKVYEETDSEHVLYSDFLHGAAAKWRQVPWVARRVPMTRKELIKRFGKKMGKLPPLTLQCKTKAANDPRETDDVKGMFAKAEIWEIWEKCSRKVFWLCPGVKETFMDEQDDFLKLDGFFPCPKPAYGTKTNDSLVPTPDFCIWQDIAYELDDVTLRIKLLVESLRVVGVYDKSAGEQLGRLLKQTDENAMVGVDNYAMFAEKGGIKGVIEFLPIEQVMVVLDKLYKARSMLTAELYEITGISDIVRGASDPRETAKAQAIKGNFANKRIKKRQDTFGRMARESLEIMAQIICAHYSDDMIRQIASAEQVLTKRVPNPMKPGEQMEIFDEGRFKAALVILRSNPLRRFRIKIDEKNLAAADEAENQQQSMQYIQGMAQLLPAAGQLAMQFPAAGPFIKSLVMLATRGFPMARSEEATLEEALEALISTPPPKEEEKPDAGAMGKTPGEIANDSKKVDNDHAEAMRKLEIEKEKLDFEKIKEQNLQNFRMAQLQQKDKIANQEIALESTAVHADIRNDQETLLATQQQNAQQVQLQREEGQRQQQANQNSQQLEQQRFGQEVQNSERDRLASAFGAPQQQRVAA